MKRIILILMAILLIPCLARAQVSNPGMESGSGSTPANWGPWGTIGQNCFWDNTVSHSGSHSLKVQINRALDTGNPYIGWAQDITVSPNTKYSIGVCVKTQSSYIPGWEDDIKPNYLQICLQTWSPGYGTPSRSLYGVETSGF